jgi:hypothetical protein
VLRVAERFLFAIAAGNCDSIKSLFGGFVALIVNVKSPAAISVNGIINLRSL